jgi:hypothetical protein
MPIMQPHNAYKSVMLLSRGFGGSRFGVRVVSGNLPLGSASITSNDVRVANRIIG